jgi:hypothetical protein
VLLPLERDPERKDDDRACDKDSEQRKKRIETEARYAVYVYRICCHHVIWCALLADVMPLITFSAAD